MNARHPLKYTLLATLCAVAVASCGDASSPGAPTGASAAGADAAVGEAGTPAEPRATGVTAEVDAAAKAQADAAGSGGTGADPSAQLGEKLAGTASCPAPSEGVQFDPWRGFIWDARAQSDTMFALVNHVRCLGGVPAVARDARIDAAAAGHVRYQVTNNVTGHVQESGRPDFTGVSAGDRLRAAGYVPAAWGEVLSRTSPLAIESWDGLVAAIYHRIGMLGSPYSAAGVGTQRDARGLAVTVVDYAAQSWIAPTGRLAVYPAANQPDVPTAFDTDSEVPDPAPDRGVTGYPVSVQADSGASLELARFELVHAANGAPVPAVLRGTGAGAQADGHLGRNASFLLPHAPLAPDTEYEVRFAGRINGTPVARTWRFRTRPAAQLAVADKLQLVVGEHVRVKLSGCSARYSWRYSTNLQPSVWSSGWMQVRAAARGNGVVQVSDGCGRSQQIAFTVN